MHTTTSELVKLEVLDTGFKYEKQRDNTTLLFHTYALNYSVSRPLAYPKVRDVAAVLKA